PRFHLCASASSRLGVNFPLHKLRLWCFVTLLLALVSCSSPVKDSGPTRTLQQETGSSGFGGETVSNTVTTNGTIVALDAGSRTIVLKYPNGRVAPYKAGPEVANFSLLKVGDEVQTTVADEVGVAVVKAGTQPSATQTTTVAKGPAGAAGGSATEVRNITGTVQQVDYSQHQVTL